MGRRRDASDHAYSAGFGDTQAGSTAASPALGNGSPTSSLDDCLRSKGVVAAWDMLEDMQRHGHHATQFSISRLLMKTGEGCAQPNLTALQRKFNLAALYRGINLAERFIQLQPDCADEVFFNALLDACHRARDLSKLERIVQHMREMRVHPSHVTLGILVKAYGQAGDAVHVMKLWEEMGEQRCQANAVTYGCMIDACVRCGYVGKAVSIFQEMKRTGKHRNTILYTTLIKGYGLERDLRSALALFREMKEERVPYNRITYNSIIDVCVKCNDVQAAENLFTEMTVPGSKLEPDLITYSTLLKGYCQIGDLDKALQVAESIKECGLRCDELVYNTLMDGCVRAGDLSAGVGLFAEMTRSGLWPSSITHSILMRLYEQSGYPGDAREAVAQLYQDHGLARPPTRQEHQGSAQGATRRGRDRDGQWHSRPRAGTGQAGGTADGAPRETQGHGTIVGVDSASGGAGSNAAVAAVQQPILWQSGLQGQQPGEVPPRMPPGVFFGPPPEAPPPLFLPYELGGGVTAADELVPANLLQQPGGQLPFQVAKEPYEGSMLVPDAVGIFCGGGLYSGGMYSGGMLEYSGGTL